MAEFSDIVKESDSYLGRPEWCLVTSDILPEKQAGTFLVTFLAMSYRFLFENSHCFLWSCEAHISKTLSGSITALQTLAYHYHLNALNMVSEISKVGENFTDYIINLTRFSISDAFGLFLGQALADRDVCDLHDECYLHKLLDEWGNASIAGVRCFIGHCAFLFAWKLSLPFNKN